MNTARPCGCKGCRTCLHCEALFGISFDKENIKNGTENKQVYCPFCNLCYPGKSVDSYKSHPNHEGTPTRYEGIYIEMNFLSDSEHDQLMQGIDSMAWDLSQSGRRKQNFGPKCNFKARKLRLGKFQGFPKFTRFVQEKFEDVPILQGFQTIEQCSLEYDPARGSSIDPHVDDCWVWGERIVTVNLLSDSVLTLTPNQYPTRYNLDLVGTYPKVVQHSVKLETNRSDQSVEACVEDTVLVPMPKNSLLVMYGSARYDYEHRILREDITERRVCLAYREFTPIYLEGGQFYEEGKLVTKISKEFFDV
ncbi:alpha-ketoglutarate-dependent dioxygenase alkB homolog 4 [Dendroctonus ponderosae]|uniref:Isopenicillin N synthase-like Fe(2+) 2OG dioxygenase domain-containing protein n=2 Tax=Dendroctonus ponderosae TaxID=77166 RepID=A0AAR5P9X3_DENPD|nr:alpha-ketoglutarate-dependent dioxygenase alkB homolog 4 [Dendroctonus ponderosae]